MGRPPTTRSLIKLMENHLGNCVRSLRPNTLRSVTYRPQGHPTPGQT